MRKEYIVAVNASRRRGSVYLSSRRKKICQGSLRYRHPWTRSTRGKYVSLAVFKLVGVISKVGASIRGTCKLLENSENEILFHYRLVIWFVEFFFFLFPSSFTLSTSSHFSSSLLFSFPSALFLSLPFTSRLLLTPLLTSLLSSPFHMSLMNYSNIHYVILSCDRVSIFNSGAAVSEYTPCLNTSDTANGHPCFAAAARTLTRNSFRI